MPSPWSASSWDAHPHSLGQWRLRQRAAEAVESRRRGWMWSPPAGDCCLRRRLHASPAVRRRASEPAITLAVAIKTGDFAKLLPYASAQLLARSPARRCVLHFFPHWK